VAKYIHSMIRVLEEERSVRFYKSALDLDIANRFDFDGFTLVYLRNRENDVEIELTINHDRDRPYDLGDGYGHIAVTVPNLDQAYAQMKAEDIAPEPIKEFFRDGALMARFFFITDPDGYRIEVLQHHGRYI
jgi:lactoylglutathione lyase